MFISASHSSPAGGGNAPKVGLPNAIKLHKKKKKARRCGNDVIQAEVTSRCDG